MRIAKSGDDGRCPANSAPIVPAPAAAMGAEPRADRGERCSASAPAAHAVRRKQQPATGGYAWVPAAAICRRSRHRLLDTCRPSGLCVATSASAAAAAIASWIRAAAATAGIASLYVASAACRWPHPHQAPPGRGLILGLRLRHLGDDADFAGRFAEVRATNFSRVDSPGRSDGAAMGATTFARVASPGGSDGVEMQQVDEEVCEPCWSVIQPKIMPNSSK